MKKTQPTNRKITILQALRIENEDEALGMSLINILGFWFLERRPILSNFHLAGVFHRNE